MPAASSAANFLLPSLGLAGMDTVHRPRSRCRGAPTSTAALRYTPTAIVLARRLCHPRASVAPSTPLSQEARRRRRRSQRALTAPQDEPDDGGSDGDGRRRRRRQLDGCDVESAAAEKAVQLSKLTGPGSGITARCGLHRWTTPAAPSSALPWGCRKVLLFWDPYLAPGQRGRGQVRSRHGEASGSSAALSPWGVLLLGGDASPQRKLCVYGVPRTLRTFAARPS